MYYTIYESGFVPYIALAKKTPFITGLLSCEPGKVWFRYGETKEEALNNLKDSLPSNDWEKWERHNVN